MQAYQVAVEGIQAGMREEGTNGSMEGVVSLQMVNPVIQGQAQGDQALQGPGEVRIAGSGCMKKVILGMVEQVASLHVAKLH